MRRVIEPFNHVDVYDALGRTARLRKSTCAGNEMRVICRAVVTRVYLPQPSTGSNGESKPTRAKRPLLVLRRKVSRSVGQLAILTFKLVIRLFPKTRETQWQDAPHRCVS